MDKALKSIVVPEIKHLGFTGSYPHFRKKVGETYQFVSFQFGRTSLIGSFVMEFGYMEIGELPEWAKELPFNKLNYGHAKHRKRVKPVSVGDTDYWFDYGSYTKNEQYLELARSVKTLLHQGVAFLNNKNG